MQLDRRHEKILVVLVALHSVGVALMFLLAPDWTARFAGWEGIDPLFFSHQAGIFHLVLACGYLIEYFRWGGVSFLVTAKSIAVVFLLVYAAVAPIPWAVPFSGVADGVMGLVVFLVHRKLNPA